jgi:hypothetical protein
VRLVEKQFSDKLNVVTLDATDPRNGDLVSLFHVDGIPHLAFVDTRANVT